MGKDLGTTITTTKWLCLQLLTETRNGYICIKLSITVKFCTILMTNLPRVTSSVYNNFLFSLFDHDQAYSKDVRQKKVI